MMNAEPPGKIPLKWQMFILSFTALFLELMVIRWVPSVVRLVAYYANLMLLSSFLGLGVGAVASGRKWRLFAWFPLLLAAEIGSLLLCRHLVLGTSISEMRFGATNLRPGNYLILTGIFVVNALVFVPVGQQMGALFNALPRLTAYAWDLGGSLCGTLCFGLFSLQHFSPVLGLAGVMMLYLSLVPWRRWGWSMVVFVPVLLAMVTANERGTLWSPYYHIVVRDGVTNSAVTSDPPPNLATMRDPPFYEVSVNQDFYHGDASLNLSRYTPGTPGADYVARQCQQYTLPYTLGAGRQRVLVVGAGGGADVQAALSAGAGHVDAVEIDPVIVDLSQRFNADAPYRDPRVSVHVDDARSYFSKADQGFDLVVFGYLDSQALFSSMTNLRLDGFVYTVESIRAAYGLLNETGMLSLSFGITQPWMALKLYRMVADGTGRTPLIYTSRGQIVLCVARGPLPPPPLTITIFERAVVTGTPAIDAPTDDWPFLYLAGKTIPADYVIVIGSLLVLSLLAVGALRGRSFGRNDAHFALLGMGFLLLETKSIGDCSLYFGATWLVTLIVVTGVLLMVLGANVVAGRLPRFSFWLYVPLFAVFAVLWMVPREQILVLGFTSRLLWTLFAVPLPVFFAGLIFSTTFRDAANPSVLFGANLIGAMVGGFSEYLGMVVGSRHLSLLVIAVYAGSLLCLLANRRSAATEAALA
jgi:hypothetical protein